MRTPINALITEKSLSLVAERTMEAFLEPAIETETVGGPAFPCIKNVCAKVSSLISDEIDEICGVLSISKREFLEAAMVQAIQQANGIMDREGVWEYLERRTELCGKKEAA